jgi:hypothetical protein
MREENPKKGGGTAAKVLTKHMSRRLREAVEAAPSPSEPEYLDDLQRVVLGMMTEVQALLSACRADKTRLKYLREARELLTVAAKMRKLQLTARDGKSRRRTMRLVGMPAKPDE